MHENRTHDTCNAILVTSSNHRGRSYLNCEKQPHSKNPEHIFHYVGPLKGRVARWTDQTEGAERR